MEVNEAHLVMLLKACWGIYEVHDRANHVPRPSVGSHSLPMGHKALQVRLSAAQLLFDLSLSQQDVLTVERKQTLGGAVHDNKVSKGRTRQGIVGGCHHSRWTS